MKVLSRELYRMTSRRIYLGASVVLPLFLLLFMTTIFGNGQMELLPVGIVEIIGAFDAGDIVRILDAESNSIGFGKINYDSQMALQMIGTKGGKPLVHYDYLWLES